MKLFKHGICLVISILLFSCMSMRKENTHLIVNFRGEEVPVMYNGDFDSVDINREIDLKSGYMRKSRTTGSGSSTRNYSYSGGTYIPLDDQVLSIMTDNINIIRLPEISFYSYGGLAIGSSLTKYQINIKTILGENKND